MHQLYNVTLHVTFGENVCFAPKAASLKLLAAERRNKRAINLDQNFAKLAGYEDRAKVPDEFTFLPDWTIRF